VEHALARYDIKVEVRGDGTSALLRLLEGGVDLVILDLGMADVDGFEVLQAMKRRQQLRGIPVIVLTGNDSAEALARSFGYGADDFIAKPFKPFELGMRAYRLTQPRSM
jgi:DNA-binding response OmpR family regulator